MYGIDEIFTETCAMAGKRDIHLHCGQTRQTSKKLDEKNACGIINSEAETGGIFADAIMPCSPFELVYTPTP